MIWNDHWNMSASFLILIVHGLQKWTYLILSYLIIISYLPDLTFKTAFKGLRHLKALAALPCPQPLQPTCENLFMPLHVESVQAALHPEHPKHLPISFDRLCFFVIYCILISSGSKIVQTLLENNRTLHPITSNHCTCSKCWAFAGSSAGADVSPLGPGLE